MAALAAILFWIDFLQIGFARAAGIQALRRPMIAEREIDNGRCKHYVPVSLKRNDKPPKGRFL